MLLQTLVPPRLFSTSLQTPSIRIPSLGIGLFSTLALAVLGALIAPLAANSQQEWTWMSGSDLPNQSGVYTSPATPGARYSPATWTDLNGNFWLFGGEGYDSAGNVGSLNDLWEFTPSNSQWTWQGGKSTMQPDGKYFI
jgi:hypothetical protein